MRKRVYCLLGTIGVLLAGVAGRLFVLSQSSFQTVSTAQSTRVQTIAVSRGTIYDRYDRPLVNRHYGVMASVAPFEPMLQALLAHDENDAWRYVTSLAEHGERVIVPLSTWLPPTEGIVQVWAPTRYDTDALACHLIGYVNGSSEGVSGVERAFDETLSRYAGEASVTFQVDALGRVALDTTGQVENTLAASRGGIRLTLDAQIQGIVQVAAADAIDRGAVVVSSAESGEVLASVSLPLYDPNHIEAALSQTDSPLLDRTRINYDLGSVFKLITAIAALENGIPSDRCYTCLGACRFGEVTIYCHNRLGDGTLMMGEALARSCNCYFIELAREVGAEAILVVAEKAGFAAPLSVAKGIQTARAILPSAEDLAPSAALANFAIGQGALMATPYHVQALMNAVARDGLWVEPTIYLDEVDEYGVTVSAATGSADVRLFSEKTAAALRTMLETVVADGTGTAGAPAQYTAAGKTGTAETGWEIDGEAVVQSWFTGYYPAACPQYVITVLSENGGTNGQGAAALFSDICDELFSAGLVEKTSDGY